MPPTLKSGDFRWHTPLREPSTIGWLSVAFSTSRAVCRSEAGRTKLPAYLFDQESLALTALDAVDRTDDVRAPRALLWGVLRNLARRVSVSEARRLATEREWSFFERRCEEPDSEAEPDSSPSRVPANLVRELVTSLSPALQAVIHAEFFEGLPRSDLARELNIKPDAARQRRSRAIRELRVALTERIQIT